MAYKTAHFQVSERLFFPPEAYLYTEGLVRFCSEAFTLDPMQLCNGCVHLTNNEAAMAVWQRGCGNWADLAPQIWGDVWFNKCGF
jgi:hypothetical protein